MNYNNGTTGEPLTKLEVEKLLNEIEDEIDRLMVLLAVGGGIRATELSSISSKNINYQEQSINIFREDWATSTRKVYYSKPVMNYLYKFEHEYFPKKYYNPENDKFIPYTKVHIERRLSAATLKILNKDRTWQSLRRTYIILNGQVDAPFELVVNNVKESVESVYSLYSKRNQNLKDAVNKVNLFNFKP